MRVVISIDMDAPPGAARAIAFVPLQLRGLYAYASMNLNLNKMAHSAADDPQQITGSRYSLTDAR
jgi:hypothetical protein